MTAKGSPALCRVEIEAAQQLWDWLDSHHVQEDSILLVTYKKAAGARYVGREAVLDALIAYGWIDGRRYVHEDPERTMQLIGPRRQQVWAESYKRRAAQLEADGRMRASGSTAVQQAKQAGLWNTARDVDALVVPGDLAAGLSAHGATDRFAQMAPSYRRNVLRWLSTAKRQPTRDARIEKIASLAARSEKVPNY